MPVIQKQLLFQSLNFLLLLISKILLVKKFLDSLKLKQHHPSYWTVTGPLTDRCRTDRFCLRYRTVIGPLPSPLPDRKRTVAISATGPLPDRCHLRYQTVTGPLSDRCRLRYRTLVISVTGRLPDRYHQSPSSVQHAFFWKT